MDPFYIALILYLLAVSLAILDIFVPSGGMLMILAAVAAVGSILFGFRSSSTLGMLMLTIVAASFPVLAFLTVKIWPHTPIGRMIILKLPTMQQRPSVASAGLDALVGKILLAESALMPAGHVKVGHRRVNAIAESGIIEQGQAVEVVSVRDRSLIVRATREPLTAIAPPTAKRAPQPTSQETGKKASLLDGNLLDDELLNRELLERPAEDIGLDSLDK